MKLKRTESLTLAQLCCRALDEKKAEDLRVLDVGEQSSITNYPVFATRTSEPALPALRVEFEKALDGAKVHLVGMESSPESGWIVVDAFDVMVHLFLPDRREHYGLENLWKDAKEISVEKLLNVTPEKTPKKIRAVRRKKPTQ